MKALKLFGEWVLGAIVLFSCVILGIQIEPVDEQLASTKQLIRRRPRFMPSRAIVIVNFSKDILWILGILLILALAVSGLWLFAMITHGLNPLA